MPLFTRIDGPADAPPLLLLHPLGASLDVWQPQVHAWRDRFRIFRYDARGHGRSPVPSGEYSIADLGEDAVSVLDDADLSAADVCGLSLGGLTALWMAIHHPSRVRRLIVANSAPRVGTRERWVERIERTQREGMPAMADLAMTTWFTPEFKQREPDVVAAVRDLIAATDREGYTGCCAALRDADLRDDIQRITAPTLLLIGDRDASVSGVEVAAMQAAIAGATRASLPAAHLANVECAEAFSRAVASFLTA